eukprot:763456-Hanusia_phi.AAC.3
MKKTHSKATPPQKQNDEEKAVVFEAAAQETKDVEMLVKTPRSLEDNRELPELCLSNVENPSAHLVRPLRPIQSMKLSCGAKHCGVSLLLYPGSYSLTVLSLAVNGTCHDDCSVRRPKFGPTVNFAVSASLNLLACGHVMVR